MKKYTLVEVKYFQPAETIYSNVERKLSQNFNHPDRYVFCNCWLEGDLNGAALVGFGGVRFRFVNGKCSNFLGEYEAQIIGEICSDRNMEADRYEAAE